MKIEGSINNIDEIDIGLSMYYGEDELSKKFHAIQIGFLIFTVVFYMTSQRKHTSL